MKIYEKEWEDFSELMNGFSQADERLLTILQKKQIYLKTNELRKWQKNHKFIHHVFIVLPIVVTFLAMLTSAVVIPLWFKLNYSSMVLMSLIYGYFSYGLTVYSLHEVNGHNSILEEKSVIHRVYNWTSKNLCRLVFADPEFYLTQHPAHHAYTATQEDKSFTNIVMFKRFLISIVPFMVATPWCDYKIHTQNFWNKSKLSTEITSFIFLSFILTNLILNQSWVHGIIFILIAPWFSFFLDRVRETSEHQLMPAIKGNEARSFGPTFWGLLIGGGPWGQCCHLVHHLAPSLPWYQQIKLHLYLKSILNLKQKKFFLRGSFFDYPKLWVEICKFHLK